jgi:hypothetical protein
MRKVKTLFILIFIFNLLSNLNCLLLLLPDDDEKSRTWYIGIENKLSYPIKVETIFANGRKSKISDIQPNEIRVDWILGVSHHAGRKAHKEIYQISVYKESDNALIMQLKGSEMDKYVICTGKSICGGNDEYQFLFEIKEENLGVGVNKGMNFEEEVGENQFENEENSFIN